MKMTVLTCTASWSASPRTVAVTNLEVTPGWKVTLADLGAKSAPEVASAGSVSSVTQATWTASDVEQTPDGYTVSFEPTRTQTAALTITRAPFELELTQADGDVITASAGARGIVEFESGCILRLQGEAEIVFSDAGGALVAEVVAADLGVIALPNPGRSSG